MSFKKIVAAHTADCCLHSKLGTGNFLHSFDNSGDVIDMTESLDTSAASGARIFQIQAEITISPSSEIALEYADKPMAGAFVNVYVSADTLETSIGAA